MTNPTSRKRLIVATLAAPLAGVFLVTAMLFMLKGPWPYDTMVEPFLGFTMVVVATSLLVGWPSMILFGLPVHRALYRNDKQNWTSYTLFGAISGILTSIIFLGLTEDVFFTLRPHLLMLGAGTGALSAGVFYALVKSNSPKNTSDGSA